MLSVKAGVSGCSGFQSGAEPLLLEESPLFLSRSSNDGVRPAHAGTAVIQSLRRAQLFAAPWTAARQASLPFTIFQSLLRLMSVESMVPSNCLILYRPLLLLPSIFPTFMKGNLLCSESVELNVNHVKK